MSLPKENCQTPQKPTSVFVNTVKTPKIKLSKLSREPCEVYIRVKPGKNKTEKSYICEADDTSITVLAPPNSLAYSHGDREYQQFSCNKTFLESSTQSEIYNTVAAPHVQRLFSGKNGMIFMYGCSGSGKTFTANGTALQPGIIPKTFQEIFRRLEDIQNGTYEAEEGEYQYNNDKVWVFVSYVEIYNEKVFDLLENYNESSKKTVEKKPLTIRYDKAGVPYVLGVSERKITSPDEIKNILSHAANIRQTGATNVNRESSRSHSILTIKLVSFSKSINYSTIQSDPTKYLKVSRLGITDLAGSERANRTNATGDQLKEANNINLSLMTLKQCLKCLKANQKRDSSRASISSAVVPFRESKLTRLLQDFFTGDSRVTMVTCISPAWDDFDEAINTLKLSSDARQIETNLNQSSISIPSSFDLPKENLNNNNNNNVSTHLSDDLENSHIDHSLDSSSVIVDNKPKTRNAKTTVTKSKKPTSTTTTTRSKREPSKRGREEPLPDTPTKVVATETIPKKTTIGTKKAKKVPPQNFNPEPNSDSSTEETIAFLKQELENMRVQLQEAEDRCIMVEYEVREEVTQELAEEMQKLKAVYESKLESRIQLEEEKYVQLVQLLNANYPSGDALKPQETSFDISIVEEDDDEDMEALLLTSDSEDDTTAKKQQPQKKKSEKQQLEVLTVEFKKLNKEYEALQIRYDNLVTQFEEVKTENESRVRQIQTLTIQKSSEQLEREHLLNSISCLEKKIEVLEGGRSQNENDKDYMLHELNIKLEEQAKKYSQLEELYHKALEDNMLLNNRNNELKSIQQQVSNKQAVSSNCTSPFSTEKKRNIFSPKLHNSKKNPQRFNFVVKENHHGDQNQKITTEYGGTLKPSITGDGISCCFTDLKTISTSENPISPSSLRSTTTTTTNTTKNKLPALELRNTAEYSLSDLSDSGIMMPFVPNSSVPTPRDMMMTEGEDSSSATEFEESPRSRREEDVFEEVSLEEPKVKSKPRINKILRVNPPRKYKK